MGDNEFIVWQDNYSVGHDELDRHHQYMLDIINRIYDTMVDSSSAPELPALLNEAVEYAQMHFRVEEEMLSHAKYPGLTNQQQAHQAYNIQVKELMLQNQMNPHMVSQDLLSS